MPGGDSFKASGFAINCNKNPIYSLFIVDPIGCGMYLLITGEVPRGGVGMRRIIVYGLWTLGLGWLVVWGISAMARNTMPSGVIWAFLSIIVWWLIGGASKEGQDRE